MNLLKCLHDEIIGCQVKLSTVQWQHQDFESGGGGEGKELCGGGHSRVLVVR